MVYKFIQFETQRHLLKDQPCEYLSRPSGRSYERPCMILVSNTLTVALLATGRLINSEAKPFFETHLDLLQESERFHFIMDFRVLETFLGNPSRPVIANPPVTILDWIVAEDEPTTEEISLSSRSWQARSLRAPNLQEAQEIKDSVDAYRALLVRGICAFWRRIDCAYAPWRS